MKLNKKYIFAAALAGGALTSCSDLLDVDHPSQDDSSFVFSNTDDAAKALTGAYVMFGEDPFTSRMSNAWMQNTDIEIMCPSAGNPSGGHRSDIWGLQASYDESWGDIYKAWNNNMETIELANNVIEGATNSAMASDNEMQQIKGEAVCLKAWRYLMLCNFWGDVPLYTVPSKWGGELDKPRTDKNIIFSHCLQQLVDVEGSMKWSSQNTGGTERMNRDFALGLIAKMSLFRAGYAMTADGTMKRADDYLDTSLPELAVTYKDKDGVEKTARTCSDYYQLAKDACQKLISLKGRELRADYASIFKDQVNYTVVNDDEILFQVAFMQDKGGDVGWCIGVTNTGSCPNGKTTNQVGIHPLYYMSFADNDIRRDATCSRYSHDNDTIKVAASTGMNVAKWDRYEAAKALGSGSSKGTGINWTLMRYSEVLLMLAEAENELNGPSALAKEMLTKVRTRAFRNSPTFDQDVTEYVNTVSASKDKFFEAIVNERAWEFGGECIRKWDLQRWNIYGQKINETVHNMNAWGLSTVPELREIAELKARYPEMETYKNWADVLYFTKPSKTKDKNDLKWYNDKWAFTDSTIIQPIRDAKYGSVSWGSNFVNKVTTYIYDGKEYTETKENKMQKSEDKDAGTVTYTLPDGKTKVTVNKGDDTGITRRIEYKVSDWAARLYRGYTGTGEAGTGAVPYLLPIGTTTITSSNVLTNDGYGYSSTYTGEGANYSFATTENPYK